MPPLHENPTSRLELASWVARDHTGPTAQIPESRQRHDDSMGRVVVYDVNIHRSRIDVFDENAPYLLAHPSIDITTAYYWPKEINLTETPGVQEFQEIFWEFTHRLCGCLVLNFTAGNTVRLHFPCQLPSSCTRKYETGRASHPVPDEQTNELLS